MAEVINIRAMAAGVLAPLLRQHGSLSTHLPDALAHCPPQDRALMQQLCYGTMREMFRLQSLAAKLLKKPFKAQDMDLQALLLIGLWQLRSSRIPAHAALHETVEATHVLNKPWAKKLFNAILRRYQREHSALESQLGNDPCFTWNHPQWFIDKISHNWPEHWREILAANDQQAPLTLRANARQLTREQALANLRAESINATPCQYSKAGLTLEEPMDVSAIPGFTQGQLSVQDEAAQLAAELLAASPGERVLDACAAPGGKLCHLLEECSGLQEVIAVELEPARAQRILDNLQRLGLELECRILTADASSQDWWDGNAFDRILVDAPCSGTGVIRRHPDIKWLRKGDEIAALAQVQLNILTNLWQMLKPGGRLVYATCSIFSQENERIIERFLQQHSDARHQPIEAEWGELRPYGRQLFPQPGGHDGFYYAVLNKVTDNSTA
ncbi:16S rRNA m(5)C-967 methyltransferase [Marinobacterium sediminicola]|uniref:16S rRNA (cytosine(967)-C(5))-methyltransferase n=1 Tax=Marinobacterium sediminicola TaxID=518898 RepID=A0ABY1S3B6_9GAMM|nr:16S rRNA (cytosine(967)-C(5))-methyltransferase RsmB [Marinobacterium sediminicola]ULG69247.1 16S rRNA (cytosine(967)-C(5))-methyltransferase RsmB [Marinobacterium sediminicola]SMR77595.1 16S rRNA m(5)C-967 methyltransferase [Marinobacterium sediminicola]